MSESLSPRFLVRRGSRHYMVYDRTIRGPAHLSDNHLAVSLALEEAEALRDQLALNALSSRRD